MHTQMHMFMPFRKSSQKTRRCVLFNLQIVRKSYHHKPQSIARNTVPREKRLTRSRSLNQDYTWFFKWTKIKNNCRILIMIPLTRSKKTIYVAMSGGVDSSVAAALIKKQGFNVVGVFFKPWSPDKNISYCNWREDRFDAMSVAAKLDIKFKTWDFSIEYGKKVADYMINSYKKGITPNPDVMCNKEIKFGLFLTKALSEGADYIATGHYVRKTEISSKSSKIFKLLRARDVNKDQSYFLWTLTQEQLKYCLFPVGEYTKPEVRKIAKKFGLPNHSKKDSQGICFVGQLDITDFLKNYIAPKKGEVRLAKTKIVIGTHEGAAYYTIGQRHGFKISGSNKPHFITSKDLDNNILYVAGSEKDTNLFLKISHAAEINWINKNAKFPLNVNVVTRYRNKAQAATLSRSDKKNVVIKFQKPTKAITPGQSAVFYKGQEVIGGGIIN